MKINYKFFFLKLPVIFQMSVKMHYWLIGLGFFPPNVWEATAEKSGVSGGIHIVSKH